MNELLSLEWTSTRLSGMVLKKSGSTWTPTRSFATEGSQPMTGAEMKEIVQKNRLQGLPTYVGLSRQEFYLAWSPSSSTDEESARQIAEKKFPLPLEELEWKYYPGRHVTFLAALPKARIRTVAKLFAEAGFHLNGFGLAVQAKLAALKDRPPQNYPPQGVLLEEGKTEHLITVYEESFPLFCRTVNAASPSLADDIQKTWVYAMGAGSTNDLKVHRSTEEDLVGRGLALLSSDDNYWFGLVSDWRKEIWARHQKNILAGAALVLVLLAMAFNWAIDGAKEDLESLLTKRVRLGGTKDGFSKTTTAAGLDPTSEILRLVSDNVPSGVHLADYRYDAAQKSLRLRGRAANYSKISDLVTALNRPSVFQEVHGDKASLTQIGNQSVVEFSVEARLK